MDELASNFRIKIEDVVERLTKLLQEKSITGVFDDRGIKLLIGYRTHFSVSVLAYLIFRSICACQ